MNAALTTTELASPKEAPVLRITPPHRWWAVPFGELWDFRELLYFFVWRDIKIRYKQTAIGIAWAIVQPLLTMLVFSLFFGRLAHIPSDGLPYPVFYYSALLPWSYFATALQNTTNAIVENQRVITKVYFPRLMLPLSSVLAGLVNDATAAPRYTRFPSRFPAAKSRIRRRRTGRRNRSSGNARARPGQFPPAASTPADARACRSPP